MSHQLGLPLVVWLGQVETLKLRLGLRRRRELMPFLKQEIFWVKAIKLLLGQPLLRHGEWLRATSCQLTQEE
jgi:hypothetical protein